LAMESPDTHRTILSGETPRGGKSERQKGQIEREGERARKWGCRRLQLHPTAYPFSSYSLLRDAARYGTLGWASRQPNQPRDQRTALLKFTVLSWACRMAGRRAGHAQFLHVLSSFSGVIIKTDCSCTHPFVTLFFPSKKKALLRSAGQPTWPDSQLGQNSTTPTSKFNISTTMGRKKPKIDENRVQEALNDYIDNGEILVRQTAKEYGVKHGTL
jgi:hypothetical protein